jgi:hypothetical protein
MLTHPDLLSPGQSELLNCVRQSNTLSASPGRTRNLKCWLLQGSAGPSNPSSPVSPSSGIPLRLHWVSRLSRLGEAADSIRDSLSCGRDLVTFVRGGDPRYPDRSAEVSAEGLRVGGRWEVGRSQVCSDRLEKGNGLHSKVMDSETTIMRSSFFLFFLGAIHAVQITVGLLRCPRRGQGLKVLCLQIGLTDDGSCVFIE